MRTVPPRKSDINESENESDMNIRNSRPALLFTMVVLLAQHLMPGRPAAQELDVRPITVGYVTKIYSKVLGEERPILIDFPIGYNLTQSRYPVLIITDGVAHFHHATASADFLSTAGRIPQMIVVGIPNIDRGRDLTPTHIEEQATSGGGDAFLKFIEEELIPHIDQHYRTQPYRVFFGHSLGGMLAVHALMTHPDLFDACIAASPYLEYDNERVIDEAGEILESKPDLGNSLFLSVGDEPDYLAPLKRLTGLLEESGDTGLRWEYVVLEDDNHMSTPLKSIYQGLEMIFADWRLPDDLADGDLSSIEAHYEKLSDKLGYEILIPEGLLNQIGYLLLAEEKYDDAIAAFELNIASYPESANVYDSLGETYETMKEWSLAKVNYEKAYNRGLEIEDPNTGIYKQHLDALLDKLSEFD